MSDITSTQSRDSDECKAPELAFEARSFLRSKRLSQLINFPVSTDVLATQVIGEGSAQLELTDAELCAIVEQALDVIEPGERVLAIVPDKTRDDNTDILFPFAAEVLTHRSVGRFDALIAQ